MSPLRSALGAGLVAGLILATAADATEWRFNNGYAPARPETAFVKAFAADVTERSGGAFTIEVLEGAGLADADALRWMQTGTPEMGFVWPPFLGRDAPDLASLYVFGSISSAEEHQRALPTLQEIIAEGFAGWNIVVPGFMGLSVLDASLFCREPVRTLEELRRVKLRVGTREQVDTFTKVGVAAQIVPQNELYTAMQTGVIDCALYPARFARSISLQEVARHATYTGFPFPPVPYAIMVNQAKWASLGEEERGWLEAGLRELEQVSFDFSADAQKEEAARAALVAEDGVTYHPAFAAADVETIRAAALETWAAVAEETGGNAIAYRERILEALGRD